MSHPDNNLLIPYVFRAIPEYITEIVWNDRDAPAPKTIRLRSGLLASRLGRTTPAPEGYVPPPGSLKFADFTEEFAQEEAERLADFYWEGLDVDGARQIPARLKDLHESREELAAVLLEGFRAEISKGSPMIVEIPTPTEGEA